MLDLMLPAGHEHCTEACSNAMTRRFRRITTNATTATALMWLLRSRGESRAPKIRDFAALHLLVTVTVTVKLLAYIQAPLESRGAMHGMDVNPNRNNAVRWNRCRPQGR